jgi:hypothetical protein
MKWKFLPGKEIPEDTPLWRYMSLGAFFLLLKRNTVFVPSLRKLQETDPKEMRLPLHSDTDIDHLGRSMAFRDAREWLKIQLLRRTGARRLGDADPKEPCLDDLVKEWIFQLGVRRWAWCWFSPGKAPSHWFESMAMWNLYARTGVAIKTTLENIRMAFGESDLTEALVAGLEYRVPGAPNTLPPGQAQDYARRPFLFKSVSYRYENEVRIVFQINAGAPAPGAKVNVDAQTILKGGEVIVSPFVVPDQQRALIQVAEGLVPKGTATFRSSQELAPDPYTQYLLDENDELDRLSQPFLRETGIPALLDEL